MYTKEENLDADDTWFIMDPDSDIICLVLGKHEAEDLLTHLNR